MTQPLTTAQAAERLGLSVAQVKALLAKGTLTGSKFGWAWQVDPASVQEYQRSRKPPGRPAQQ